MVTLIAFQFMLEGLLLELCKTCETAPQNIKKDTNCYYWCMCTCAQLCLTLCDPMECSLQTPLFMKFSRQEYWSGLPFPSPGDLPDPGTKLTPLGSTSLASRFFHQ